MLSLELGEPITGFGASFIRPAVNEVEAILDAARERCGAAVMGVLNVTPDSFSDGGRYLEPTAAESRVDELVSEGADILDIGGESSRPGARPVSSAEQIARLEPAVKAALRHRGSAVASSGPVNSGNRTLVSIDTTCPAVAERMLELGAHIINDVSCLANVDLARIAARFDAHLVIMHSRGSLGAMAGFSNIPENSYADVVEEVLLEWRAARDRAVAKGLPLDRIWFDPGLGFAKSAAHSFTLLRRLAAFRSLGARVLLGPSRKSFIAAVDPCPPSDRLGGTLSACLLGVQRGASVLRVHDVRAVKQALLVMRASSEGDGFRA